jgi:hypothetical protein
MLRLRGIEERFEWPDQGEVAPCVDDKITLSRVRRHHDQKLAVLPGPTMGDSLPGTEVQVVSSI